MARTGGRPVRLCRVCDAELKRAYYHLHPTYRGKRARSAAAWKKSHPEKAAAHIRASRTRAHPAARQAGRVFRQALAAGGVEKATACQRCGAPPRHAHHPDYRFPTVVQWLCVRCHKAVHGGWAPDPAPSELLIPRALAEARHVMSTWQQVAAVLPEADAIVRLRTGTYALRLSRHAACPAGEAGARLVAFARIAKPVFEHLVDRGMVRALDGFPGWFTPLPEPGAPAGR
jgi:ribosomal protein S27AE